MSHVDDVFFIFGKYINPTLTKNDRAMLEDVLDYWYSVAKNA